MDASVKRQLVGSISVAAAAIIFGCESVGAKVGYAGGFNVISLAALCYIIAIWVFCLIAIWQKAPLIVPKGLRWEMLRFGLLVCCSSGMLYLTYYLLPATFATLFFSIYPAFTALVARFFFHQRLTPIKMLALVPALAGIVLLYWSASNILSVGGVMCALAAATLHAFKLNLGGSLLPKINLHTYNFNLIIVLATVFNLAAILGIGGGYNLGGIAKNAWQVILFLALMVTVGANFLQYFGLNMISAVDMSIIMLLQPLSTALVAWLVFDDTLTGWQICGGLLILLAIALPPLSQRFGGASSTLNTPI